MEMCHFLIFSNSFSRFVISLALSLTWVYSTQPIAPAGNSWSNKLSSDCVTTSSSALSSSPVSHLTPSRWSYLICPFRRSISTLDSLPVFKILLIWYVRCCPWSSNSPSSFQYWCILFLYPIFGPFFAFKLHNIAILLSFFYSFDLYLPMGHLPGKKPSPSVPASFTSLFYDFLLDINLTMRHSYPPLYANLVF